MSFGSSSRRKKTFTENPVGAGLPAKNDDAQYLKKRGAFFAGKPAPTGFCVLTDRHHTASCR
ncbi:hypothetical protein C5612_20915 [Pseudomonas frederiksbergensis]|uniref:Uncharacterized protein n=2 Tax=Pseudomonas frederiksbergensis TaxID=104087 RepID=A0A2S8HG47_9PSED|nr:hypothetical protein C5612_20915 [Pseudomonas frederiksbergensis]